MASAVTMQLIYKELKMLKKDMETVKYAVIPEEKVSARELEKIRLARKEIKAGKAKSFKEVFG